MVPMDNHAFQSAHQDSSVSGRLIASRLFWSRGFGEVFSYRQLVFFSCTFLTSLSQSLTYMGYFWSQTSIAFTSPERFFCLGCDEESLFGGTCQCLFSLSFLVSWRCLRSTSLQWTLTLRGASYHIGRGCLYSPIEHMLC